MSEQSVQVRVGRYPVEGWFLAATVAGAVAALAEPSGVVAALFPPWVLWVWYGNFAVWALVALAGILPAPPAHLADGGSRRLLRALHLERVGAVGVAFNCLSYGAAALAAGPHGVGAALWLAGVAAGFAHRVVQLTHDLRLLRGVMTEGLPLADPGSRGS